MAERRQQQPCRKEKTETCRRPVIMAGSGVIMELSRQSYAHRDVNTDVLVAVTASLFLFFF